MPTDAKLIVHQLTGDFLRQEAPVHLAELEQNFENYYADAEKLLDQQPEAIEESWALPFDAVFTDGMFLGVLVSATVFLVREALAASQHQRQQKVRDRAQQLAKQTQQPEIISALCAQVLDLTARLEGMIGPPVSPPDLELQVHLTSTQGKTALSYILHSTKAGFHFETIPGPVLTQNAEIFAASLFEQIERLHEGFDVDDNVLQPEDVEEELSSLGRNLFRQLFPPAMRQAYRRFCNVRSVQITSDELAIPWELLKPYDDHHGPLIDHDFFCMRFQLTRWLNGRPPVTAFPIKKLACFGKNDLPHAAEERDLLADLATRHREVKDASPSRSRFKDVTRLLEKGGCDLLHFIGHGDISASQASESSIDLEDRPFRSRHLIGPIQTRLQENRPLVFLNACRVARQAWSLTGLDGWVKAWIQICHCGAFVGPQWVVDDSLAYEIAKVFYLQLEDGQTLGEAALEARRQARRKDPTRPSWLALAVYGHPNARLSFGGS